MPERRPRDLIRVLKPYGIEFVASGGKHPRFKRGSDTYLFQPIAGSIP